MSDDNKKTGWQAYLTGAAALLTAMATLVATTAALIVNIGTLRDAWCNNIGMFCSTKPGPIPNIQALAKLFTPIAYEGKGIAPDPDNNKYNILVNYRAERQEDAERIVGALQQAGYINCDEVQSTLDEVIAPVTMKIPRATLIKTTALARQNAEEVFKFVKLAIPQNAPFVTLFPENTTFQRKVDMQIDLF